MLAKSKSECIMLAQRGGNTPFLYMELIMSETSLIREAQAGLADYRDTLIHETQGNRPAADVDKVRQVLRSYGVVTVTPLLAVPFEEEALERVVSLNTKQSWTDPFANENILDAQEKRRRLDAGEQLTGSLFPTAFYSSLLDVAVVFTHGEELADLYGPKCAEGIETGLCAHELTHSAFGGLANVKYEVVDEDVRVTYRRLIGQSKITNLLRAGRSQTDPYLPSWIDEAFANYTAVRVLGELLPEARPHTPYMMEIPEQTPPNTNPPRTFLLQPNCLIQSERYPDFPARFAGTETDGMNRLRFRAPELLPKFAPLSSGTLSVGNFHTYLHSAVGEELYAAMTEQRPYSEWSGILDLIGAMPVNR